MPNGSTVLRVVKELDQSMEQETMFYSRYLLDNGKVIVCGEWDTFSEKWTACHYEGESKEPFCASPIYRGEYEDWPEDRIDAAIERINEDDEWSMLETVALAIREGRRD